jgi:Cell division protein FtsI/penicillin-binding protein 2
MMKNFTLCLIHLWTGKIAQLELIEEDYKNRTIGRNETRPSLEGLIWTPYNKRSYPEGDMGANMLGFYSFLDRVDGRGYYGVEESYNDLLAGTPKQVYTPFDPQKSLRAMISRQAQVLC